MARKLVDIDEAARMLGISTDAVTDLRERRELFGVRDGGAWKFKQEDVERLVADRAEGDFAETDENPDSVLLSEVELGQSSASSASTIIGGKNGPDDAESDIQLAASAPPVADDDDLTLSMDDDELSLDSMVGADSKVSSPGDSGISPMFDDMDTLDLDMASAADSGVGAKAKATDDDDLDLTGGSGLNLDDELSLDLGGSKALSGSKSGSAVDLTEDLDDDLVLGGSSHGSGLSRAGDSGISLLDPADSGLSLDLEPAALGDDEDALELGEESPSAARSGIVDDDDLAAQADDDFLLTPLDEENSEDSDSGSQVIAIEDEVDFGDTSGVDALEDDDDDMGVSLGADLGDELGAGLGAAAAMGALTALTPTPSPTASPSVLAMDAPERVEAGFGGMSVVSLAACSLVMMVCGMFMYDLLRNMWSWDAPYALNSSMMDSVAGLLGMK